MVASWPRPTCATTWLFHAFEITRRPSWPTWPWWRAWSGSAIAHFPTTFTPAWPLRPSACWRSTTAPPIDQPGRSRRAGHAAGLGRGGLRLPILSGLPIGLAVGSLSAVSAAALGGLLLARAGPSSSPELFSLGLLCLALGLVVDNWPTSGSRSMFGWRAAGATESTGLCTFTPMSFGYR